MIDLKTLKELVTLMVDNDLTELDVRDGEESVALSRPSPNAPVAYHPGPAMAGHAPQAPASNPAPPPASGAPAAPETNADDGLVAIESPMVGTFYAAGSPDAEPFIKVGDRVAPDTVVCLVEAMKVFSEVKAEVSGTVKKIVAANGGSVEFGEPLMLVDPD